jgi:ubiquinone/menaquinone biosynthesis C-methylase UbiE
MIHLAPYPSPSVLAPWIAPTAAPPTWDGDLLAFPLPALTPAMEANIVSFGHPQWARQYLEQAHRSSTFQHRWLAATGSWHNKVVVDIGCGPGNVYAALREHCGIPQVVIGVDISRGGLLIAKQAGYLPVLADAHQLPFVDGFADLVLLNATLHHCENMAVVLQEAARILRPGGKLVIDHDPQKTMWKANWLAHLLWQSRLFIYRAMGHSWHANSEQQHWVVLSEIHHRPGAGVTPTLFQQTLAPLGLSVHTYCHNGSAGAEVLRGVRGRAGWKIRLAQRLTGVDPDSPEGAMVVMCVAQRGNDSPVSKILPTVSV